MHYSRNVVHAFQTYQKFKQPKSGFVVESFGGVDKKEDHKAIKGKWVHVDRDDADRSKEAGQEAQAPQYPQESSNLQSKEHKRETVTSYHYTE